MNDTKIDCPNCRYDTVNICDEPCCKCSLSNSEYEPQPLTTAQTAVDPAIDTGTDSEFDAPDTDEPDEPAPTPTPPGPDPTCTDCEKCRYGALDYTHEPCNSCSALNPKFEPKPQLSAAVTPQPVTDPDAPDLCATCSFVFTDSARCRTCDGRTNYTADTDPNSVGAVGDVEQQAVPSRSVYAVAHDAIDRIEAMARVNGIEAERIEIKVDTKRKYAAVRDAEFHEVTFSLAVGE